MISLKIKKNKIEPVTMVEVIQSKFEVLEPVEPMI